MTSFLRSWSHYTKLFIKISVKIVKTLAISNICKIKVEYHQVITCSKSALQNAKKTVLGQCHIYTANFEQTINQWIIYEKIKNISVIMKETGVHTVLQNHVQSQ